MLFNYEAQLVNVLPHLSLRYATKYQKYLGKDDLTMKKHSLGFKQPVLVSMLMAAYSNSTYAQDFEQHPSHAQNIQLAPLLITVDAESNEDASAQKLQRVAGATNMISSQDIKQNRLASTEDILKLQPGIYAKSAGNEGVKVSIRGSGINRAPGAHASGVYVLLDDIPFTGPGGTPYELLEPLWLNRVEVYRGANGFDVGALALGGAINYQTHTGLDAKKLQLRTEMGSHGYQRYALSSGQQIDDLDYYISLNTSRYDGYQNHAAGDSQGLAANVGYQISPEIETRFYLRHRETEHQTPGRLTKDQIENAPQSANPNNLEWDAKRIQPGSTWFANKTTFKLKDDAELVASLAYHNYPMDLQESPYRIDVTYSDVTASLNYKKPHVLFDRESIFKILLRSTTHRPDTGVIESLRSDLNGFEAGTVTRKFTYRGSDNVLQFSHDLALTQDLHLQTGLAAIYTHRESEVYYPYTGEKLSEYDWNFAPRLGLLYALSPTLQLYSNVSRSIESAHPWSMIWGSNQYFPEDSGAATDRQRAPIHLDTQTAQTVEFGGRGESRFGQWDLSYYYAKVKNELLNVEISQEPSSVIAESNASDTIHQGVEFGLISPLFSSEQWGDLSLRQAYTYSDFHYKNDPIFGKNQLAGLPKHLYQAQLKFDFPQGFYAAIDAEYRSELPVDYANSFKADAYTLWGASLGYQAADQQWNAWLDFKNLSNTRYAATVTPGYDDAGKDIARSTPSESFSTYAGITFNF